MGLNLVGKKFLVLGGTSFLGKNLKPYLENHGSIVNVYGSKYDLTNNDISIVPFIEKDIEYDYIIHAAILQGAADWPLHHKAEQFDINCRIHTNVLKNWHTYQPQARLVRIGSTCSYPGDMSVVSEEDYWKGPMHESVDVYGLTKKVMVKGITAYKDQYGLKGTTAIFATLFGPHDEFDPSKSHVVSALIKKFVDAKENNEPQVEIWGDGTQTRELIYVEDQIKALLLVLDYDGDVINIGTGESTSIKKLAETISSIVDYKGELFYNTNRFVGAKHKVLDITKSKELYGWTVDVKPNDLKDTLTKSIDWYRNNKYNL